MLRLTSNQIEIELRQLALLLIRAYQRFVSPYKGFCCAYWSHTGRRSCSALGHRAIRQRGLFTGLLILRERTWRCGIAHRRYGPIATRRPAMQRGDCDCDLPCDGCDCGDAFDLGDCCDCDFGNDKRKKKDDGNGTHLPPSRSARKGAPMRVSDGVRP